MLQCFGFFFQGNHQIHEHRFLHDGRLCDTANKHGRSPASEISIRVVHLDCNEIFAGPNQQQKETEGLT